MNKKLKIAFTNTSALIKYGIASGFEKLGHEIIIMDNEYRMWDKPKEQQAYLIEKFQKEYQPDLYFSECFADYAEENFLVTRMNDVPHFFWSIEDTPDEHWIGDHWSRYADHIFTTTAECLPNYWNNYGKNSADLLPFGVNVDYHKPTKESKEYFHDIVLVGTNYSRREDKAIEYYYPVIKNQYDFKIYGNSEWMNTERKCNLNWTPETYQGLISYEKLNELYSSCKIVLGAQCDDTSYTQMSMRNFEVLGWAGNSALMVSPYSKSQEFIFGQHIYLPKNGQEMLDMIDEILNMEDKHRISLSKEAQKFVYKYHNYEIRAKKVIDVYYQKYS